MLVKVLPRPTPYSRPFLPTLHPDPVPSRICCTRRHVGIDLRQTIALGLEFRGMLVKVLPRYSILIISDYCEREIFYILHIRMLIQGEFESVLTAQEVACIETANVRTLLCQRLGFVRAMWSSTQFYLAIINRTGDGP